MNEPSDETVVDPVTASNGEPDLPADFIARVRQIVEPDRQSAVLASFIAPPALAIRLNPLQANPAETRKELEDAGIALTPVPWCAEAFAIANGTVRDLQATGGHDRGAFHIQSLSSSATGCALAPKPGEHVLDLCAAPGSKTSHLGALMNNSGRLVALDLSRSRSYRLRHVLKTLGVDAETIVGRGEQFGRRNPGSFDAALVDAPCSGEGRFRSGEPKSWGDWSLKKIRRLASLQKSLLHSAIEAVRPGGTLVYSTCTFAPEENELVLARALKRYDDRIELQPLPINLPTAIAPLQEWNDRPIKVDLSHARRILPGAGHDGFFIACLRRM